MDRPLTDFIEFDDDPGMLLSWDNFTNPTRNSLQRLLSRTAKDTNWRNGISYAHLEELSLKDIEDIQGVGLTRRDQILQELRTVFAEYETDNPQDSIAPLLDSDLGDIDELDSIDLAENFAEIVEGILILFNDYTEITPRNLAILRGRVPGFISAYRTLEDLAVEFGITRERVRQIEAKFIDLQLSPKKSENNVISNLLKILEDSESEADFQVRAASADLIKNESISIQNLSAVCDILGLDNFEAKILQVESRWRSESAKLGDLGVLARSLRNKLGLVDLSVMQSQSGSVARACFEAVLIPYPRSLVKGNLVLARTQNLDTLFENALGKQLRAFGTMSAENALEGIRRQAAYRQLTVYGSEAEQIAVIKEIGGAPPNYETFLENTIDAPIFSDTDSWFLELFKNSPTGMLHRAEVSAAAVKDRRNVTSVGVYTLFNPLLRPVGSGVLSLAETEVDSEIAKIYADVARAAQEPTAIDFCFKGSNLLLTFKPNINTIGAGVLFPKSDLRDLVKSIDFLSRCRCLQLISDQHLRLRTHNFWTGFTAMIRHGMSVHNYGENDSYQVLLDFESKIAELLPM